MSNLASKSMRVVKNYAKAKVREATSNDPWGPSGTQMNELAQLTYNQNDFVEIMEMLDKRLNDKGKNWRHVFKSLTLLDYLLHAGSENVVYYFKDNAYIIKTLKEFQHVDDDGRDQGANVRQKAKDISNLLADDMRLRDQRKNRAFMRDRMTRGAPGAYGADEDYELGVTGNRPRSRSLPQRRRHNEDDDLARALEASMRSQEEEQRRLRAGQSDDDLSRALKLSQEEDERRRNEEARRKAELDAANSNALFDDSTQIWSPNAYNQPQQVDFFGNPIQSQPTGMADMNLLQPQMTSYNPFQQQQEALAMQQQQQQMMMQQQQQQQQMAAQQQAMFTGMLSPQPLQEQKTGYRSNNPFATHLTGNAPVQNDIPQPSPAPVIPTNFAPTPSLHHRPSMPNLPTSTSVDFSAPRNPGLNLKTNDNKHENIATALASGSGQDTFGNEGLLRIPTGAAKFAPQKTGGASPFGAAMPSGVTGTGGGSAFGAQAQSAFAQAPQAQSNSNLNNPWSTNTSTPAANTTTTTPFGQQQTPQKQNETPFFTL
ncbi:hypothetical protein E3P99_00838 [Wallemia hederae]|uniref:ENTH domain-containing protein n=1 Tax=Wallemia hederae TaxID=1540922 RepID=A0A4T0FTP5_9BASI|nr:hypothetical protein E3P99_00838 [Wallemia hederae]